MRETTEKRMITPGISYGVGAVNIKKLSKENMTNTTTSDSPVLLSNSKDKSIIPPFKGFCKKAQKNHNSAYIKRYLVGLMAENVVPTPLNEARHLFT